MRNSKTNRYARIIERIFFSHYKEGVRAISFEREDIIKEAKRVRIKLPKNLGDVIYSFRYRTSLPESIQSKAPEGEAWIIRPAGRGLYRFVAIREPSIVPNKLLSETKIPDATPGLVTKYSLGDEQSLLAKLRYNRLIDIFTGVTCYSLQNHLRTYLEGLGQIETDELYIGVDKRGVHYVFPIQAKGGTDKLNVVQIEQDMALCKLKFPSLICRSIGAQFMKNDVIVLFEFEEGENGITISSEKHYKLVAPDNVTLEELDIYRSRAE